ncbi:MAG: NAD(P)/FAD-dependent oxidoreductase [Bacteroidota bacterium]
MSKPTVLIIGGGAAGFFAACLLAEKHKNLNITILEKDKEVLKKVRISGGGRCNVTHACYDPNDLVKFYPRGEKELYAPFLQFQPKDTIEWFSRNGVVLKTEADGRMFPITDSSETIIDCFMRICKKHCVDIKLSCRVTSIRKADSKWEVIVSEKTMLSDYLIITAGSSPSIWAILGSLGHSIVPPVPSLFTFKVNDRTLNELAGISLPAASVKITGLKHSTFGPVLITHWGLSGPAILKMSAWASVELHELKYEFNLEINWLSTNYDNVLSDLKQTKETEAKKQMGNVVMYKIPYRFWIYLLNTSGIQPTQQWANITKKQTQNLAANLTKFPLIVKGKSTNKDEFVTAGGISLKDVNFKSFQSKIHENIYFAGEVLNIDGLTGGFNFQSAWTGAYILSKDISSKLSNL